MFLVCRNTECKQWLCRLGCKPHPTQHTNWVSELINWNRVSTNFWPRRLGVCGFVCVEHAECVLVQFEAHIVVFSSSPPIFLCPPSLSLSLSFCVSPSLSLIFFLLFWFFSSLHPCYNCRITKCCPITRINVGLGTKSSWWGVRKGHVFCLKYLF